MEDIAENPLKLIFLKNADGETSEEIENLKENKIKLYNEVEKLKKNVNKIKTKLYNLMAIKV